MSHVTQMFDSREIASRVESLAETISGTVSGDFIVVGLLKGGFMFVADLVRALDRAGRQPQIEFVRLSSYGNNTESSGNVRISCDLGEDINGRQILLVDDIVDSGRSLLFAKNLFLERGASKVWTCALLDKPSRRAVECEADFVGFSIEDAFVVGYGIDYAEKYRHLPYIGYVN